MKSGLYHKNIYMPKFKIQEPIVELTPTRHSEQRGLNLPTVLDLRKVDVVEMEVRDNQIVKMLVRVKYDNYNHLVMAIALPECVIKTAWKNSSDDQHSTLDVSKYIVR